MTVGPSTFSAPSLDAAGLGRVLAELPDSVIVIDQDGRIQWANQTAEGFFGRSLDGSIGLSGLDLVHPEDIEFVLRSLVSIQGKGVGAPIEVRLRTPSGWRLVELIGTPIPWLCEGHVLLCLRDLTARRRFEISHDEDARFRTLVQNAAVLTMLVSPYGVVQSCSGALTRLLGHDSEEVEGRPLADLVIEGDKHALDDALRRAQQGAVSTSPVTVTLNLRQHEAGTVPFELSFVNLVEDPTVGGFVVSGHDVTDRKLLEGQLAYQALHDPLTGLANRALFNDRLHHALATAQRSQLRVGVLFLDLDNFKSVNDELGHAAGDEVLRIVGRRLSSRVRSADSVARLGGDEFGIIPEFVVYPQAITTLAKKILGTFRTAIPLDGQGEVVVTGSIGIAVGSGTSSEEQLLQDADRAMYSAKGQGGNRYELVDPGGTRSA